ncbi:MAG: hypothetical protein LBP28_08650 [Coriobacteriales bacterium]|nr:hypothetical protein [Coriobacteriales bacterium]
MQKALALLVVLALVLVSFNLPSQAYAFNGYLEDCDFDGYDDETHEPVPWYGFDATKGDTVPSDWDGAPGSYAHKTPPATPAPAPAPAPPDTSNAPAAQAPQAPAASVAPQAPAENSVNPGDSGNGAGANAAAGTNNTGNAGGTGDASTTDDAGSADTGESREATIVDSATPLAGLAPAVAAIVGIKGTLEVTPQKGNAYLPGATIVIKGASFAGNVKDLQLTISSDNPQLLGNVTSSLDGTFEATVVLPDDLQPGKHDIIVRYQDAPIVKRTIDVVDSAEPASASIDPIVGVAIFAALLIIAAGVLLGWAATRKKRAAARQV